MTGTPLAASARVAKPVPFDVVAIAASAGGISALISLFSRLPTDLPVSYLVVQHLDRHHRSHLVEVLNRRTELRVIEAEEGMRVQPGTIFVAPPDRHLLVDPDGVLALSRSGLVHNLRPSADRLFESVGASYGKRAIIVVLTGTGSDGALGVKVAKAAGGTVLVQENAQFNGMPNAAIDTGQVDRVLLLADIPDEIVRLVRNGDEP